MRLFIKNMVCPRCIMAVRTILVSVGITPKAIHLGEVEIEGEIDDDTKHCIAHELKLMGFELLDDPRSQLVEQLRVSIIEWVRMADNCSNLSDFLVSRLHKDYSALSKLFNEVKGVTIERFAIIHRIEHAKELLFYNQLSISEIAYKLGYSSPAHFSTQFKQITGMTPKMMRSLRPDNRIPLSEI